LKELMMMRQQTYQENRFSHDQNHHDYALLQRLYDEPLKRKSQAKPLTLEKANAYQHLSSLVIAASLIFMT